MRQTECVSVVSSPELGSIRPVLADAVDLARQALLELGEGGVGEYLGVTVEDDSAATHRFASDLDGYRGWQWAVVVAAPDDADHATVSELVLLPGPDALVALLPPRKTDAYLRAPRFVQRPHKGRERPRVGW